MSFLIHFWNHDLINPDIWIFFFLMQEVAEQLGEDISKEKLQEMIHFADKKNDGTVTYKEFVAMMERPQLE